MSIDRIYKILTADTQWSDINPQPPQSVLIATQDPDSAYLVGSGGFTAWDALTATIVGSWDSETGLQEGESYDNGNVIGTPTHPVTADYTGWIRPLGNEAGRATGLLDSTKWQGHVSEKFLFEDFRYTPTDAPFTLEIIRQDYGSEALPWDNATVYNTGDFATSGGMWQSLQDGNVGNTPFGGSAFWEFINQSGPWGWLVKMLSDDPGRDITARAIGIYTDPEATIFEYTTGAFINDGKYGDVFYTECPPGNREATAAPIYFALLLGSAQEGIFQLDALEDGAEATALFWTTDQGAGGTSSPEVWFAKPAPNYWDDGSLVTHIGRIWLSTMDANHWTPGTAGTEALWVDQGPE